MVLGKTNGASRARLYAFPAEQTAPEIQMQATCNFLDGLGGTGVYTRAVHDSGLLNPRKDGGRVPQQVHGARYIIERSSQTRE